MKKDRLPSPQNIITRKNQYLYACRMLGISGLKERPLLISSIGRKIDRRFQA